jgi:indolepyruvate ferredoxin oxidoreductase, beta subunit
MAEAEPRPVAILIAALGGEGGGVLTNWIVEAATAAGYPVQSTSIPGVAQRTGATTYYLEVHPRPQAETGRTEPVMTLTPGPGDIDVMVASELLEAGRAMENGFISPERTTLIASTHRIYAVAEKAAMADGRYPAAKVIEAATAMSQQAILLDFARLARESGSVVNAVLLGAIAAAKKLPFDDAHLEKAIRASGIAVEANLEGFRRGREQALNPPPPQPTEETTAAPLGAAPSGSEALLGELRGLLAGIETTVPEAGLLKTVDFQDLAYGRLYVERLGRVAAAPGENTEALVLTVARCLANWMAYEDVVRVADLKTRAERFERVRREVRAQAGEPIAIVDYFKPGPEEFAALLPGFLARPLLRFAARGGGPSDRWHFGLYLRSSSIPGFMLLRCMAGCRRFRRLGHRFGQEQAEIEAWLQMIVEAKARSAELAREIAECGRLIRGYGDTHRRGRANFRRIVEALVRPGLASTAPSELAMRIAMARDAALADPEGKSLDAALTLAAE